MRSPPFATWTWLPLSAALLVAGCGSGSWEELATPTPRATRSAPQATLVSSDGTTFAPGRPKAARASLNALSWRRVTVDDGRLVLHLRDRDACAAVDRVEVGPADGDFRRVAVMADYAAPEACGRESRQLVLDLGTAVDEDTVVTKGELLVPEPRLTAQRSLAGGGGVLQADRRTIITSFSYGSCEGLAETKAKVEGRTIIVAVVTGVDPGLPEDTTCPGMSLGGQTLTRLPRPAPDDAEIIAAWCVPGPGCSV